MLIVRPKGPLVNIIGNWTAHSCNLKCHVDNLKLRSLSFLCSSTHRPTGGSPLFVGSQTFPQTTRVSSISRSVRSTINGTWRTERTQVPKIQLHIVHYLVIGTPIQSLRRRPITSVRCYAERFRPKGFRHTLMVEHGALDTGEHPQIFFLLHC